ncbi:DEAD/DEAH box helicase [Desulfovulcanus sp.]
MNSVTAYLAKIKKDPSLALDVVWHEVFESKEAEYGQVSKPWSEPALKILAARKIDGLYSHQIKAIDLIRDGKNVVVATPTASGKSLIYNLPVLETIFNRPDSRALYLFPLKALAQDQKKSLQELLSSAGHDFIPDICIYDGDTKSWQRSKIRQRPPQILITNPDMLHLSILPYHHLWHDFFQNLSYVVVDEVHTYRGVMGSHMAWVFRRLLRICRFYGRAPQFVFCSATIKNPQELSSDLTGLDVDCIEESGAPRGRKHFLMARSLFGAATAGLKLLELALKMGLRTIVYTQSRKMAELLAMWMQDKGKLFKHKVCAYRAGFLPEERRNIEARLSRGELLAVVSTSALELGIDIGNLDLCLMVGYPGSIMATWQRMGRVGRSGQEAAAIFIGHEDALDQYFLHHPKEFLGLEPEKAVINPYNPVIMGKHLICAAADLPLKAEEDMLQLKEVQKEIDGLLASGKLIADANGCEFYASTKYPHRHVDIRGSGQIFNLFAGRGRKHIGHIDEYRAYHETHPGAIYLHMGKTYLAQDLDLDTRSVQLRLVKVPYFTRVRTEKSTEILQLVQAVSLGRAQLFHGKLRVTEKIVGYEKRLTYGQRFLGVVPLELPPLVFETEGIWLAIPKDIQDKVEKKFLHFMGGIHALEHILIGIMPLLVLTDRNDLGGISIPMHTQVRGPAVFVYDGVPGGLGLTAQAFVRARELLGRAKEVIKACDCENGCPKCVHSPKCGSGNRPLDKEAASLILDMILEESNRKEMIEISMTEIGKDFPLKPGEKGTENGKLRCEGSLAGYDGGSLCGMLSEIAPQCGIPQGEPYLHELQSEDPASFVRVSEKQRFAVLDIETRRSAQEVGGWGNAHKMGISCVVVYDGQKDSFLTFRQEEVDDLVNYLTTVDLVVGFNILRFDYNVLKGHCDFDLHSLPTLDILEKVHTRLGYRLSLDHLAKHTLGVSKSANGLLALRWWKEGKLDKIIDYCRQDVAITRDLYFFGRKKGYLLFRNKAKKIVRVPVDW